MWKRDEAVTSSNAGPDASADRPPSDRRPPDNLVMDLGKSVMIKGEISASEDMTIYGQMEGRVTLPGHTLTIGPHADIKAAIAAKIVVIHGAVTGNVTAGEKVDIRTTGAVVGAAPAATSGRAASGRSARSARPFFFPAPVRHRAARP